MGNENMAVIGLRISKLREKRGLSQKQLADELEKNGLKVRRETVTQWENGSRDLKTEYTVKLADFFGVTCDYILRGIESENVDICKETGLTNNSINRIREVNSIRFGYGTITIQNAINSFVGSGKFVQFMIAFLGYQIEVEKLVENESYFMERLTSYREQLPNGTTVLEYAAKLALEEESSLYSESISIINQADRVNYQLFKLENALRKIADSFLEDKEKNG